MGSCLQNNALFLTEGIKLGHAVLSSLVNPESLNRLPTLIQHPVVEEHEVGKGLVFPGHRESPASSGMAIGKELNIANTSLANWGDMTSDVRMDNL
jgi:hypothetical protein